jgi:sugar phosphate isomerase/epimerase
VYGALSLSALEIDLPLSEAIRLARTNSFDALDIEPREIEAIGVPEARALLADGHVRACGFYLPVDWQGVEEPWRRDLRALPRNVEAAVGVGALRCFTWIRPGSDTLSWESNFEFHVERLSPVVDILERAGCRLGLEYVGAYTMRAQHKFEFVHTLRGTLELGAALGGAVGVVLDGHHWYALGSNRDELLQLRAEQIVYVHVNDARAGIAVDDQIDIERELPLRTGVIDLNGFMSALQEISYDGPVVVEPFSAEIRSMSAAPDRVKAAADALRATLDLGT